MLPRAKRWRSTGHGIVCEHMQACVKDDDSYFEQSTYYHLYALDMFAFHAVLEKVSTDYREKSGRYDGVPCGIVSEAAVFPISAMTTADVSFTLRPAHYFARASLRPHRCLGKVSYFGYSQKTSTKSALVAWPRTLRVPSADPPNRSRGFLRNRHRTIRCGPVFALFDAGPFGPGSGGHSHSDTLSLVVSAATKKC